MGVIAVTKNSYQEILEKNELVILDFWASWCGPCRAFAPIFTQASIIHPQVVFGAIDTEQELAVAHEFQIRSVPTVMAFRQNILLFSQIGGLHLWQISDLIQHLSNLDMAVVNQQIAQELADFQQEQQD